LHIDASASGNNKLPPRDTNNTSEVVDQVVEWYCWYYYGEII